MTIEQLEQEAMTLSPNERLALAQKLLESLSIVDNAKNSTEDNARQNPLLKWAGVFSAEPSDISEKAEDILFEAIKPTSGFGE